MPTTPCVSEIRIHPIKSTAAVRLDKAWVEEKGLACDRRFVIADTEGNFITARKEPRLILIETALTATGLVFTAPGQTPVAINYLHLPNRYQAVKVWNDTIEGQLCGPDLDQWFSNYLDRNCQLLFFGDKSSRQVRERETQVGFADAYPLLLISRGSLQDLNRRCNSPVAMAQFRPNIVVDNCDAFAEDGWRRLRIGSVEFEVVSPCSRCVLTTVAPGSGQFHPTGEPLATLKKFRRGEDGNVYFGQNVVALNEGKIAVGDRVEVLETKTPVHYHDLAPPYLPAASTADTDWPAREKQRLRCMAVRNETHDVKTFVFKCPDLAAFRYLPGQHLTLELDIDGKQVVRNYTLSSSPSRPDTVTITVKRVAGGVVSNYLHDHLKVNDQVTARAPDGDFHSEQIATDKVLLLSAGSGITPMLSILRTMSDRQQGNDVVFLHSAHSEKDLIARDETGLLARQHGKCDVRYTLTKSAESGWQGYRGRLDRNILADIDDLAERTVFVCGPTAFMVTAKTLLLELGLPEERYFQESFGVRAAVRQEQRDIMLSFSSSGLIHNGNNHETILQQAEQAGLDLPYSCRAGICATCRVKLVKGDVEELSGDTLTETEKLQGYILACSCIPKTDIVISEG